MSVKVTKILEVNQVAFAFAKLPIEHSTTCNSRINLNYMSV